MTDQNRIETLPDAPIGIDETKEVFVAVNETALFLLLILLDGLQLYQDVKSIIEKLKDDEKFREVLQRAVDDITKVPDEIGDLSAGEGVELLMIQAAYVPKYLEVLKKAREIKALKEAEDGPDSAG